MAREMSDAGLSERERRMRELEQTLASLREDAEVMHVLLGLSSALAEVRSVEETLEKTVRMVAEVLGADRAFAATADEGSGDFFITADHGFDARGLALLREHGARPKGLPLLRAALLGKAPLLVSDAGSDDRISPAEAKEREIGAYIGIPLIRWGEDFGGLGVEFSEPRRFTAKDTALARGLARQVGVALSNARRFNLLQSLRSFGLQMGRTELRLAKVTRGVAEGACRLLSAQGAVVSFLDQQSGSLVAAGQHGLSEATIDAVAFLDSHEEPYASLIRGETIQANDLGTLLGIEDGPVAMVAAAILGSEESVLGAVMVFFERSFQMGQEEADALDVLASQGAMAIENAQRFERQRRVARSLQQALLSIDVSGVGDCEYGAVYEAATSEADIGGDFFDLFDLPGGRVGLVVGDVSGKGAEAAALTAMAKYMLRAFAQRDPSPSSVLYHLNNALANSFEDDRFTTLVYALLDHEAHTMQVALGGHPPPMIYRGATGEVEEMELPGSILGAFEDQQYPHTTIQLGPGDKFVTFTDGLVEARDLGGDLYGRERVLRSLQSYADSHSGESLARAIYEDANSFGTIGDDTVVFVLACPAT